MAAANRILAKMKEELRVKVKAEMRKNFNIEMLHKSGYHKMTYTMVRALCSTFKRDYAKIALIKSK